ncbi:MAG: hypothetical protein J6M62_00615 [Selenomonadaceae bacterium]|nr:hypothetical protein [Selenomonadaceae bacterium]
MLSIFKNYADILSRAKETTQKVAVKAVFTGKYPLGGVELQATFCVSFRMVVMVGYDT